MPSYRDSELVHAASKEAVTDSSGRQHRLWRPFQQDRVTLRDGGRHIVGVGNIDGSNLTSTAQTSECAGQILQFVVLNKTIGIAVMMAAQRGVSSACTNLSG